MEENCIIYCNIPPEYWIDLLGTLEAKGNRGGTARKSYMPVTKKKKTEQTSGDDSNSEANPWVPYNKNKHEPVKGK